VEREHALSQLPVAYAVAIRLSERGADDQTIAEALGIPVVSLPALLKVGTAKLAQIVRDQRDDDGPPSPGERD
jgi:hypothetical protein